MYSTYATWAYSNIVKHKEAFEILGQIEKMALEYENEGRGLTSENENLALLEICANTIYTAAHLNFQSGILQLEFGFVLPVRNQIRAIFELATDQKYLLSQGFDQALSRAKRISEYETAYRHYFKSSAPSLFENAINENFPRYEIAYLEFEKKYGKDFKHWSGKTLQQRLEALGNKSDYDIYRVLSQGPHVTPLAWDSIMKKTPTGTAFLSGPADQNIDQNVFELATGFCEALFPIVCLRGRIELRKKLLQMRERIIAFLRSMEESEGKNEQPV